MLHALGLGWAVRVGDASRVLHEFLHRSRPGLRKWTGPPDAHPAGGLEQLKVAELMNMACAKRGCQFVVNTGEAMRCWGGLANATAGPACFHVQQG